MEYPIVIDNLSKVYGKSPVAALNKLSLHVAAGECYGFLGANGAGKSTAIRLLLNFIQPTSGSAKIMDKDVVSSGVEARKHIGYLSGDVALYGKPTGQELLDYLCDLQGLKDLSYRHKLEKRFQADLKKPIASLSKGNRQKLGIIQAFMHKPSVLILDEPTSGIDPLMQEAFYLTVKENTDRGAAVFMSSHNLAEAQRTCDRVGIIKQGKLVHEQEMKSNDALSKPLFHITLTRDVGSKLKKDPQLKVITQVNNTTFVVQPKDGIAPALASLSKYDIKEFSSKNVDLEDEFLEFYGDTK